jgi:hypothetical protein
MALRIVHEFSLQDDLGLPRNDGVQRGAPRRRPGVPEPRDRRIIEPPLAGRDVKGNGGVINLGVPRKEGVHDRDADA